VGKYQIFWNGTNNRKLHFERNYGHIKFGDRLLPVISKYFAFPSATLRLPD
jgi:hypothetical protein